MRFSVFVLFSILLCTQLHAEDLPPVAAAPNEVPAAAPVNAAPSQASTAQPNANTSKAAPALFGAGGGDSVDITADKSLEWHDAERMYIASGHARAKKGDVTIEAEILKAYDRKKPDGGSEVWKLTAEGNVHVIGKTQQAFGDTAEYNIDTRRAILKGKGLKFVTATDTVTARDSLEYWELENKAIATGDAVEIRDGRQVRADTLVAQFKKDAKGELVSDTMTAKGNVHITTDKDTVLCDEAIYYVTPNTATLTGHVYITQGANQLQGDKAEADFKTNVSRILNTGTGRVHALILATKDADKNKTPATASAENAKPAVTKKQKKKK